MICALTASGAVAADEATPEPSATSAGTPFASGFGYTLVLPEGWRVTVSSGDPVFGGEDLFEGPAGWTARIGGGQVEPDQAVEDRVATNRADMTADGTCRSDPSDDTPTSLGGARAIAWSMQCPDAFHASINTVHDGVRLRLDVNGPAEAEAEAAALLEAFRTGFTFDAARQADPGGTADLTALEQTLEGSYETAWRPVELELAAVEAAGLDPHGDPDWREWTTSISTVRHVLKFEDGAMTQYCASDGGPLEICWGATYRLLDADTIEAIEIFEGRSYRYEYTFALEDGILTLDVVDSDDPVGIIPQTAIFETLPFTRIP
jgi:hypothetical protein